MNPISYALAQLDYTIPREIMEKVFISNIWNKSKSPLSLHARIREEVIEKRVLTDCNLMHGTEAAIPLAGVPKEQIDMFMWVYRVPKFMTQNRTITRALSVSFGEGAIIGATNMAPSQGNAMLDAAAGLLNSSLPIPIIASANCQVIGENVILIQDNMALPVNIYLRCWLENDQNMNHIQPASYPQFAKLVEYAVKAHIWVKCQIPMDRAFIFSGSELGRFGSIIESYAEANDMYATHRDEVWVRVAHMNDKIAHTRALKRTLGGLH
jgi:hypothetical protein